MRRVVISADDVGIAPETNAAVEIAHREGVLSSASVMTNMPAFADAVAMSVRNPRLGTGVHLVLTSGRPVRPPDRLPLLVDAGGRFRHGYVSLSRLMLGPQRSAALDQIDEELTAQVGKARQAGMDIDHIDSHRHVHMIPAIWPRVLRLAEEQGGMVVRNATERPAWTRGRSGMTNVVKTLVLGACGHVNRPRPVHEVHFAGLMDSGCVNVRVLGRLLRELPPGLSEIVTHPSHPISTASAGRLNCSAIDDAFLRSRGRQSELAALLNPKVRRMLEDEHIQIVSFRLSQSAALTPSAIVVTC